MPILFGLTLIIIVFLYFSKSRGENAKKKTQEFWQKERDSQFVPKKDISSLDYILIPYESLPFSYYKPGTNAPVKLLTSGDGAFALAKQQGSDEITSAPEEFSDASGAFAVLSEDLASANGSYERALEFRAPYAEELAGVEQEICALSDSRILNLTGISNTELRLTYGTANLDPLTAYDQNFTVLIRALQKWGTLLSSAGKQKDAVTVLSYAVSIGSDIAATYTLLARLYKEQGDYHKIEELKESAEALTTLMKPSILRDLEQISSIDVL